MTAQLEIEARKCTAERAEYAELCVEGRNFRQKCTAIHPLIFCNLIVFRAQFKSVLVFTLRALLRGDFKAYLLSTLEIVQALIGVFDCEDCC